MGVPDPCCGMSLQKGTKILAIVQIVFAVIGIIIGILAVIGAVALSDEELDRQGLSRGAVVALVVIYCLVCLFDLIIAVLLLLGSNQRDLVKCRIWFIVAVVLMVISLARTIGDIAAGESSAASLTGSFLVLIIRGYCCWVVLAFMAELKGVNVPTN